MDKFVYVKTLEKPLDKNQKQYIKITDQENQAWSIFNAQMTYEVGKCYLFQFHMNDRGYPEIEKVTPLVNVFKQEALKEIANKNDIIKNFTVCYSYAKDLVIGGKIELKDMTQYATTIYDTIMDKAEKDYNLLQNSGVKKNG